MAGSRAAFLLLVILGAFLGGRLPRRGRHPDLQPQVQRRRAGRQGRARQRAADEEGLVAPVGPQALLRPPRVRGRPASASRRSTAIAAFPMRACASFDVKLNDTQDKVDVTLDISEGEPIRVAAIDLRGLRRAAEGEREDAARRRCRCSRNARSTASSQLASRERALNVLRDQGYPYAEVSLHERGRRAASAARSCSQATPGMLAHFGADRDRGRRRASARTSSAGSSRSSRATVSRAREMRESQRKLYGLELFEFVNVESLEEPVRCSRGSAGPRHRRRRQAPKVTSGIGYGTEEQARARIRWDHLNFFGGAQHAGFEGQVVVARSRRARSTIREPYFLAPNFSLNFDGQAWQATEPVYATEPARRPRHAAAPGEPAELLDGVADQRVPAEHDRRRRRCEDFTIRDDLIALGLDPRGDVARARCRRWRSTSAATRRTTCSTRARATCSTAHVGAGGQVAVGHLQLLVGDGRRAALPARSADASSSPTACASAASTPAGDLDANVPFYKRYFLGGASSIRGWGRFEVSPLSGFGFPIGGLSMLEGSSEVRFPVWGKLGAVGVPRLRQRLGGRVGLRPRATCATPSARACAT